MGPGVASVAKQCDARCADSWRSGWSNGREGSAACAPCLRNKPCRGGLSAKKWCNEGWAKTSCSWTCCRAGLLHVDTCVESRCQGSFVDSYAPKWPSGKINTPACLECLHDDACREHKNPYWWCKHDWAAEHCPLTCCTAGLPTYAWSRDSVSGRNQGNLPLLL
jgi:hypothetical protein